MKTEKHYFAYGSNMNREAMAARCPEAKALGTGFLPGWRLVFRGRGSGNYLTIEEDREHSVPVVVWAVSPGDEKALDLYEDYPRFYFKKTLSLSCRELATGRERRVLGFAYIMEKGFPAGQPTEPYMAACLEGCKAFGLDPGELYAARRYSEELEERDGEE